MGKKRYFLLLVVLLLFVNVGAQEDLSNFDVAAEVIAPPSPPIEGEKSSVVLKIFDYNTKDLIGDIHVGIRYFDMELGKEVETLQYVGEDGIVELYLLEGEYTIALKVDEIDTQGKDYFNTIDLFVNDDISQVVYLFPVGSVMGNVYDGRNNAISNALLKFECSANYGELGSKETDSFGSYTSYWLPIGTCKISASYRRKVGYEHVEIKKGELNNMDIVLSGGLIGGPNMTAYIILIALIIAVIIYLVYNKGKIIKNITKKEEVQKVVNEQKISKRTSDILNTLKEKEKVIVKFLLDNGSNSTQSKIRYATGIPKTSLARLFISLEGKKVISVERIGKLKKIKLTDWFLGKD